MLKQAYDRGKKARTDGVELKNNPYRKIRGFGVNYDTQAVWWDKGWQEGNQPPRCEITKNLCGTDTRPVGQPCQCATCRADEQMYVKEVEALKQMVRELNEIAAADKALRTRLGMPYPGKQKPLA